MAQIKKRKIIWLIVGFFILNLVLKIYKIHSVPPSLTYDEVIYTSEAQSIIRYGSDLTGNWHPWDLEPSDAFYTELTSTILVPGFLIFPNDFVLASKFMPLLFGSLLPILLGLIAYRLYRYISIFITTVIIATFNPWIFQFSRMGYDSLFSIGFYLIGIVMMFYLKKYKKIWSIIPFFLGFYQYQGHKLLLVPLVFLTFLFIIFEKIDLKKIKKSLTKMIAWTDFRVTLLILIFVVILTIVYMIRLPNLTSGKRSSEFSIVNQNELMTIVNTKRRLALESSVTPIFINKYFVLSQVILERFFDSFDPQRLFIEGNRKVDTFAVLDYGYFHLIDIFLIMASLLIVVINKEKKIKSIIFILFFILVGTLPNLVRVGTPWIIFRGAFSFLGIVILLGVGSGLVLKEVNFKARVVFISIYILAVTPFLFIYFYRYPITHTNNIAFYERVMANYIKRVGNEQKVVVIPDRMDASFKYLISYNSLLINTKKEDIQLVAWQQKQEDGRNQLNNLTLLKDCPRNINELSQETTLLVYITKQPCNPTSKLNEVTRIKSLIDSGLIYIIYNDKLCSQFNLGTYPLIKDSNDLNVEQLSNQQFCEIFFSRN